MRTARTSAARCSRGAYGAAAALAGGEADAYVVIDDEAHATGNEATIAVRPCPPVTLLEDHATESSRQPLTDNALTIRLANDADACERSLADAHSYLDSADSAQLLDLAGHEVTPHYVLAAEARCWLWLRPGRALTMYEDAVKRWPRHRTRSRAVHQARLARACVAADEPERAAYEGVEALEIARATKSKVILRDLAHLDDRLAACDVPAAADFRERFAAL